MKPIAKKLSSVILSLAMVASLTPFPGGLMLADETEAETPATVAETEPEKKEPEKPAETKAKETKPEAETSKETEKPAETEAPKETESAETEAPKETEKPAETPDETVPETEAPAENEKPEAEQPKETEAPAETEKPAEEIPEETEAPAETPDETTPERSDKNKAKDVPIEEKDIDNIECVDGILKWDVVEGATQYEIEFDDHTYTVKTNSFELGKEIDRLISLNEIYKSYYNDYYIYITAYDSNGVYKANGYGDVTYTTDVTYAMKSMTLNAIKNGVLSWKAVPNATTYGVRVKYGSSYYDYSTTETKNLSINLNTTIDQMIQDEDIEKSADGKYDITVLAYNKYGYTIAQASTSHTHASTVAPIVWVNISGANISTDGVLTWNPVEGATSYYVELTSAWGKLTDKASIKIGDAIDDLITNGALKKTGKYYVSIVAYDKNDRTIGSYDGYLAYESSSTEITQGKITGANVDSNGILKWDAYDGANEYEIEIEGEWSEWLYTKSASTDLYKAIDRSISYDDDYKPSDNKYRITITAFNKYGAAIASCDAFDHTYESEATYTGNTDIANVKFDTDGTMSWDPYNGAVKYEVYVSDVKTVVTTTKFAINSKINSLVASGTILKESPYSVFIYAYDKDDMLISEWWGSYYFKTSSAAPVIGEIANVKSTLGILSWSKVKNATKYKISLPYDNVEIGTTSSNALYLNDAITNLIKAEKLGNSRYFYVEIYALNKKGTVIAKGDCSYKYLETNTLSVVSKTTAKKAAKAKRRKKTKINPSKLYNITNRGQGRLTFSKVSGKKQFSVNKTTGKITVKKGLKKKTYTVKVKIAAAGQTVYAATTRTVTLKIKVK